MFFNSGLLSVVSCCLLCITRVMGCDYKSVFFNFGLDPPLSVPPFRAQPLRCLGKQLLREKPLELGHFLRQTADLRPEIDVLCQTTAIPWVLQR